MFLENLIPQIPTNINEIVIYIAAFLGIVLFVYGVFMDTEKRQDLVFMLASGCLFVYALYISNLIFMIAMGGFFLAALIEFFEILFGIHSKDKYDLKKIVREGRTKVKRQENRKI